MVAFLPVLMGILERGCIGSFVVLAIYLASRVMKFDDFSLEGTFGLGGAVAAWCLLHAVNPWAALLAGAVCGGGAGCVTGLLHTKLGLNRLISGIVVTTMLFSVSINIGGANVALGGVPTVFSFLPFSQFANSFLLLPLAVFVGIFLVWYMKTESGFVLRSTGINEQFVTSLGKSVHFYIGMCLVIANFLSALAGGLFVQYSGFYSAFGNVGTLIAALAGCMIAELFGKNMLVMALVGSIIYQLILSLTLELQVEPSWQKLLTGLLIVLILILKKMGNTKKRAAHA